MERPRLERRRSTREPGLGAYSAAMRRLVSIASRVAAVDSTVLIIGESGVGKERLARYIHSSSPRAAGPFIAVNCGALPDGLF
jgi:transcriptional regulator with PAS, ATPase and Fis domain